MFLIGFLLLGLLCLYFLRDFHNRVMDRKWDRGESPGLQEMAGRYRVWMLPRCVFFWFLNTKRIEDKGSLSREGQNTAFGIIKWGKFVAVESITRGMTFVYGGTYRRVEKWHIRDYIVRIAPGKYLGKFCLYRVEPEEEKNRMIFLFWFTLTKTPKIRAEDWIITQVARPKTYIDEPKPVDYILK